jgi:hypothetical protein
MPPVNFKYNQEQNNTIVCGVCIYMPNATSHLASWTYYEIIITMCISIARQRVPAVITPQQYRGCYLCGPRHDRCYAMVRLTRLKQYGTRRCFPLGPCKMVTKKNSIEKHRVKWSEESSFGKPVWRGMSLGAEKLNWVESSELAAAE